MGAHAMLEVFGPVNGLTWERPVSVRPSSAVARGTPPLVHLAVLGCPQWARHCQCVEKPGRWSVQPREHSSKPVLS